MGSRRTSAQRAADTDVGGPAGLSPHQEEAREPFLILRAVLATWHHYFGAFSPGLFCRP